MSKSGEPPSDIPGLHIRQRRQAAFRQFVSPVPAAIRVDHGLKKLRVGETETILRPGEFGIIPDNVAMTVENIPGPGGCYEARAVALGRDNIEAAYRAQPPIDRDGNLVAVNAGGTPALNRCFSDICAILTAAEPTPEPILDLRRQELVMRLAEAGAVLAPARPQNLSSRLRAVISGEIAADWTTARAAAHLSMSEASLRRKLAAEGTSFSTLLTDIRMIHALGMLQTTRWTIAAVALESGYESPSRFAARFRARFGLAPSEIRHSGPNSDRIGTAPERIGRADEPAIG